ncbi:MAG: glycosyl hydrolase family 18 protein [Saprospiraceae bacterium]|nr:glycosyl hydrolase family 18 protein [Saprospiraceae bacterium]
MNYSNITYYIKYFFCALLLIVFVGGQQLLAQGFIERKVALKSRSFVNHNVGKVKTGARMSVNSKRRSLKSSLRGGRPGKVYDPRPTVDELMDDEEAKSSIYDNTNKKRYVELFGAWTDMPSDAQMDLRAEAQAIKDSLSNLDRGSFRVTKKIWDDSRTMVVFGWHPHWMGELYRSYDYQLFNVVSYYSYDINPDNGAPQNSDVMAGFLANDFVSNAHDNGCSALLSITCHGEQNVMRFLSQNIEAQQRLMDSVLYILDSTNADGIEINFEGVNSALKDDFLRFVRTLSTTVTSARGDTSFVFLSVPTFDPENIYDISRYIDFVDVFVIKGFDFHQEPYGLKKVPAAPLNKSPIVPAPDLRTSVDKYIANLGPIFSARLVLALPYFGTRWVTDGITEKIMEMDVIPYSDIQFDFVMQKEDQFKFPGAKLRYDETKACYIFSYLDYQGVDTALGDVPYEVTIYFDDTMSLRKKYQFLKDARLGGVGIQFLGSDAGFYHLQELLSDEFTDIEMPEDDVFRQINEKSSTTRNNSIYILAVLMYLSIFMAIGLCAALFNRRTRQALFDNGRFRMLYMAFFTFLMLLIGGYLGLFEGATIPLLVGVVFGALMSWIGWRLVAKKKSLTP